MKMFTSGFRYGIVIIFFKESAHNKIDLQVIPHTSNTALHEVLCLRVEPKRSLLYRGIFGQTGKNEKIIKMALADCWSPFACAGNTF